MSCTPDEDRFVMIELAQSADIVVVLNWFEELQRLVDAESDN